MINKLFDHTVLGVNTKQSDVQKIVEEGLKYKFFSVCIPPYYVKYAKNLINNQDLKITTVISFPHGNETTKTKVFSTKDAIKNGADEIDMVLNVGLLKEQKYDDVLNDIKAVKKACGKKVLKVIIETSELSKEEIKKASLLCIDAKADFVKTSTGFTSEGATVENVKLIKETINNKAKVKASGGIRTLSDVLEYQKLNVERIGASKGVSILEELKEKE